MGARGPVPKRQEARTRRNKTNEAGIALKKGEAKPFTWKRANPNWEPEVRDLYNSFKKSGMAEFFQATEVHWLYMACDELNDYRTSGNRSAMRLQAVLSMFSQGLGITEGDRRRMQIELEAPAPEVEDELAVRRRELEEQMRGHKA